MNPRETFGVGLNDTVTVNLHVLNDQNELTLYQLPVDQGTPGAT